MKPLSEVAHGLLVNQIPIQAVCIERQGISTFLLKSKMNEISHQLAINPAEILDQCVLNDDVGSVVVMETPCLNSTWSYWIQLWSQSITTRLGLWAEAGHRLFNWCFADIHTYVVQVILCQKHSFLHQWNQNMTTDCSLNYEFNTRKLQIQCMLCTSNCFLFWHSEQFVVHNMYWTCSFLVLNS